MKSVLLAIDVGGSTSRATVVDLAGNCLGQGRNRGGNPGSNPPEQAAAAVIAAAESAVAEAGEALDIGVALLAIAGPRNAEMLRLMEEAFRRMGLTGPMVLDGDTNAMLPSVTAALDGYCIFAGTGSGAVRVRGGTIEAVADAAGYLLGDLGSGYWLGHHAAMAVTAALEGRGPQTALTRPLLDSFGISMSDDSGYNNRPTPLSLFIDAIYTIKPIELARYAPHVIANPQDPEAAALMVQAEAYLLEDLRLVFDPGTRGPVVLGGSVASRLPGLPAAVTEFLHKAGHEADILLAGDPSIGAAVLALRHQGVTVDEAMLKHIVASMAARATKLPA